MTAIRAAGCCCDQPKNVGIFCPNQLSFTRVTGQPSFGGYSIEQLYKNIYDNRGKGKVVRIDSEATLMSCGVAFFGVLTPTNLTGSSPLIKIVYTPEVVTTAPTNAQGGLSGYASGWWTSSSIGEALSKFVASGGRLVFIGEGYGVGSTPTVTNIALDHVNQVFVKSNNGNSSGVVQYAQAPQCNNCYGECFCVAGNCAKYTAIRSVVPNTPFSFYQNNGIYNSSGCYLSFFAPGSSNEIGPLVGSVGHGTAGTCGNPFVGPAYPVGHSALSGGYQMVVADVNCFMVSPVSVVNPFSTTSNGGQCPTSLTISSTINSACNPSGLFTGLSYFDINLPFLWTLNEKCPTC